MIAEFRDLFTPPRNIILIVAALWIGLLFAESRSEKRGVSKEELNNITFYSLLAFIFGGRIVYALQHFSLFAQNPLDIISINPDLFDTLGAIVTAAIVALAYMQRKNIPAWNALDALLPIFATLAIGLSLSHLASGFYFGIETNAPWGIEMWNATRHPVQIYSAFASLLVFILFRLKKYSPTPGIDFLTFAALTAFAQIIIHPLRADGDSLANGIKYAQIFAWLIMFACFVLIEYRLRKPTVIVEKNIEAEAQVKKKKIATSRSRKSADFRKQ